jgi:RNA recognition motif-containing protein
MSTKLFVAGLSYSTTHDGLVDHFSKCGTVRSARIMTDPSSGRSRRFGFVEMSTDDEGAAAITRLNGQMLDGRSLKIEARPFTNGVEWGASGGQGGRAASERGRGWKGRR